MDMEESDSPFQMAPSAEIELVEGGAPDVSAMGNDQSMDNMNQAKAMGYD